MWGPAWPVLRVMGSCCRWQSYSRGTLLGRPSSLFSCTSAAAPGMLRCRVMLY